MPITNKIVYIAGPVTGLPHNNKPMFDYAHEFLRQKSSVVINPSMLPVGLKTHKSYMNICLPMVRESEALLLLPGWENSVGANMEVEEARRLSLDLFAFNPDEWSFKKLSEASNG